MPSVLLLQTSRSRDAADDAALLAAARELAPLAVTAATADPARTERATQIPAVRADVAVVLRGLARVDAVVVLGGRPLASHARDGHLLGLAELAALSGAVRAAGKRYALVGVGVGPVTSRREAFWVRQIVSGSALTVLDDDPAAQHLVRAGVPEPLRVGADLAWLDLQAPPQPVADGDDLWCTVTSEQVSVVGGAAVFADQVDRVLRTLRDQLAHQRPPAAVTIQAWHGGGRAGDDLDTASEVADRLQGHGHPTVVAPPPQRLSRERDVLRGARFCLSGHPHALMAAAASGVPLLAWPYDDPGQQLADRLELTSLPRVPSPGQTDAAVRAAVETAGTSLPVVRQQVATAGEVADLLRLLLTGGDLDSRPATTPRAHLATGLRPTGVLR